MDGEAWTVAGVTGGIVLLIREVGGLLISSKKLDKESEEKKRADEKAKDDSERIAHEQRVKAYTEQVRKDYDEMKVELNDLRKANAECEKKNMKLEARVEVLTTLYGEDTRSVIESKVHKILEERAKNDASNSGSLENNESRRHGGKR